MPLGDVLVCRSCDVRHPISTDDDNPLHAQDPVCCRACGAEFFPPPNIPEIEVDERLRRKTRPHRRYLGRPEMKGRNYIQEHRDTESRLVRGTLAGGHPYAWVEIADVLFDPGYQRFYAPTTWYEATGAEKHDEEVWPARQVPPPVPPGDRGPRPRNWLTVEEAATRAGVTVSAIERVVHAGWLWADTTAPGGWRIPVFGFDQFAGQMHELKSLLAEQDKHEHS